jgi:hypothetical protein
MPVHFRPRFGPWVWSPRGHRTRFDSVLYWLLGFWAVELAYWLLVGLFLAVAWLFRRVVGRR